MPQLPFTFQAHVKGNPRPEADGEPEAAPRAGEASEPPIFSVSQLQRRLRTQLERHYPQVWVAGELSNFSVNNRSGHAYFTLKDPQASLNVVMFDDHLRRLQFRPRDGLEVLARGTLTVWPKGGRLQLSAVHLEPRGLGALQQAFEALVEKLRAEGLTDPGSKRPRPPFPRTVGVVTSRGSAAMRDVLRTLLRRDPRAHVRFAFAPVQGRSAAFHIVRAIERLDAAGCDVLIIARGGGSAEDLWAFNEEPVARAVLQARAPVIAGIGHETDTTVVDLVADVRASTPTAAAELALPVRSQVEEALAAATLRLGRAARGRLLLHRRRLDVIDLRLPPPQSLLAGPRQTLDSLELSAERLAQRAPKRAERRLAGLEGRLHAAHPRRRLEQDRQRLDDLTRRLGRSFGAREVAARRAQLAGLEHRLHAAAGRQVRGQQARLSRVLAQAEALSPLAVLRRGFSLTTDAEGGVLRDAARVGVGDTVEVRLAEGRLRATVTDVEPEDRG